MGAFQFTGCLLITAIQLLTPPLGISVTASEVKACKALPAVQLFVALRVDGVMQGRDPEAIWREIKTLAQAEVVSDSLSFNQPSFTVKVVGSTPHLTIRKGEIRDLGFDDDPYGIPFKQQILIESLRRALAAAQLDDAAKLAAADKKARATTGSSETPAKNSANSNGYDRWACYLEQSELLVRQTIVAIEIVDSRDQLKRLLQQMDDQIEDLLYNKLFESIDQYAQENGINVFYDRGGPPGPVQVSISSEPRGAKIWVMTHLRYQQQVRILKTDRSKWPWRELVQNPTKLVANARYRYLARWPDGREAEGDIEIRDTNPITFRPQ